MKEEKLDEREIIATALMDGGAKEDAILLYEKVRGDKKLSDTGLYNLALLYLGDIKNRSNCERGITMLEVLGNRNKLPSTGWDNLASAYWLVCQDDHEKEIVYKTKARNIWEQLYEAKKIDSISSQNICWFAYSCFYELGGKKDILKAYALLIPLEKTGILYKEHPLYHQGLRILLQVHYSLLQKQTKQKNKKDWAFAIKLTQKLLEKDKKEKNTYITQTMENLAILHWVIGNEKEALELDVTRLGILIAHGAYEKVKQFSGENKAFDFNLKDIETGKTALQVAAENNQFEIFCLLVNQGADLLLMDKDRKIPAELASRICKQNFWNLQ